LKKIPILESIIVPDWLYPTTFSEFVLVEASPCHSEK